MLQSKLFTKTRKEAPADEISKNANLLVRAGFIHKEIAGVYSYLPLGLKVINNIADIVRKEMNEVGGQELSLSVLQEKELWETSKRWDDKMVDGWFKTKLKNETEVGLGFTHEEPITRIMMEFVKSYKNLPLYPYQIQTKFRNEARAKGGIIRGKEFLMKDLYSFSKDEKEHMDFYERIKKTYKNIFDILGIGEKTYLTFASGGSFAKYSHEFQTVSEAGEDTIYIDEKKNIAVNKEVYTDEVISELGLKKADLVEKKSIEVGNIFTLGTRFSQPLGLTYLDEKDNTHFVVMGSYGLGIARLMGTIVEVLSDDKGIVWPECVAPFKVHLIELGNDEKVKTYAKKLYEKLKSSGVETLHDDRTERAGEKFADADLLGIPLRVVVSEKTISGDNVEIKKRKTGETSMVSEKELIARCTE